MRSVGLYANCSEYLQGLSPGWRDEYTSDLYGQQIGSRFFAAFYFVSVLAAAICHLVVTAWMGAPPVPTVGASGGIYGVLLAYGIYFPNRQLILLFPPIPMRARTLVVVYAALELFLGVTGTQQGVAHFAHLGGMLGGYLMIQYRRGFRR